METCQAGRGWRRRSTTSSIYCAISKAKKDTVCFRVSGRRYWLSNPSQRRNKASGRRSRREPMLRSVLVGVDGSEYSVAAVELGIQWARHSGAVLVGLGIIDAPTISKPEPVPLGGSAYKIHHDASLLADASHKV